MTREQARELFSAALEGELGESEQRALDAALAQDPELAREYADFGATLALLRNDPDPGPAPNLLSGVQHRLRSRSRGRFYADRFAERLGVGAGQTIALALVMLALLGLAWLGLQLVQQVSVGG
jgi:anti-sigma factor RsiW